MERRLLGVIGAASIALATQASADVTDGDGESLVLVLDVTTLTGTGTPSLQLILEMLDDVSGKYISFGTFVAVTATGTYTYAVGLGIAAAGDGITAVRGFPPPDRWRARVVAGGATITNATYTVSAQR